MQALDRRLEEKEAFGARPAAASCGVLTAFKWFLLFFGRFLFFLLIYSFLFFILKIKSNSSCVFSSIRFPSSCVVKKKKKRRHVYFIYVSLL